MDVLLHLLEIFNDVDLYQVCLFQLLSLLLVLLSQMHVLLLYLALLLLV